MNDITRSDRRLSRRRFLTLAAGASVARCARARDALPARDRTSDTSVDSSVLSALAPAASDLRVLLPSSPSTVPAPPTPIAEVTEVTFAPGHRGVVFEPERLGPWTARPLILLFDPGGNARGIVDRYSKAAHQHGWLAASAFGVADGTPDDADTTEMMFLLEYVRSHHPVDAGRVFTGGFSGGACGAYRLAIVKAEVFAGAIVECGHMGSWRDVGHMAGRSLRFYLFTRDGDFNRPATRRLRDAMQAKRYRVTEVERGGGHAPMEDPEVSEAMDWMEAP